MTRHKLIQLLASLSRKEMTRFREFAFSPYHNKHEKVRELVVHLSASYPDFSEITCGRYLLFLQLFPGEKYDKRKLALIFTYTYRLWEEFACLENLKNIPEECAFKTLSYLRHFAGDLFEKNLSRIEKKMESEPYRDAQHQLIRYRLATEADLYFAQQGKHETGSNILHKQTYLDHYFISEKLKNACEITIRKRILRVDYKVSLLEIILKEVAGNWPHYKQVPSVAVYFKMYRLLSGAKDSYFEVVDTLGANEQHFRKEERQLLYHNLQNYCIEQINTGRTEFLRHGFELYQLQLKKQLLSINGALPEAHYKTSSPLDFASGKMIGYVISSIPSGINYIPM